MKFIFFQTIADEITDQKIRHGKSKIIKSNLAYKIGIFQLQLRNKMYTKTYPINDCNKIDFVITYSWLMQIQGLRFNVLTCVISQTGCNCQQIY